MKVKTYHKLVRDRIPEIIEKAGKVSKTRILDEEEYIVLLRKKLEEEMNEYLEEPSLEELADILEVVYALAEADGHTVDKLNAMRLLKAGSNGAFKKRIFLEEVSDATDPNRPTVKLALVKEAIEMADDNSRAYYDLEKNELIWYIDGEGYGLDEDDEVMDEIIEEGWLTRFFRLPEKREINDYSVMESFIENEVPEIYVNPFLRAINGRGAFRNFSDCIDTYDLREEWYAYKDKAYRMMAIRWCDNNDFNFTED